MSSRDVRPALGDVIEYHSVSVASANCFCSLRQEIFQLLEDHARRVEKAVNGQREVQDVILQHFSTIAVPVEASAPFSGMLTLDDARVPIRAIDDVGVVAQSSLPVSSRSHTGEANHRSTPTDLILGAEDSQSSASQESMQALKTRSMNMEHSDMGKKVKRRVRQSDPSPGHVGMFFIHAKNVVSSGTFEYAMLMVIGLNSLFIGVQIDMKVNTIQQGAFADTSYEAYFDVVESAFCFMFVVELIMRSLAKTFLTDTLWFVFDFVLVFFAALDELQKHTSFDVEAISNVTFFRILRLCKLFRMLRVIRAVRSFRELRVIVMSIASCLRSLGWTLFLLVAILFLFATVLLTTIAMYPDRAFDSTHWGEVRSTLYGSFGRAMLTLFMTITSGMDWKDAVEPLEDLWPPISILFVVFIAIIVFAIMNIVTGVFVDQAMKSVSTDHDLVAMEEKDTRQKVINDIGAIFKTSAAGEGTLSVGEMRALIRKPEVRASFKKIDMEAWDLETFLDLVDTDDGMIDVETFVNGTLRVKGSAKNIDVIALRYEASQAAQKQFKTLEGTKRILHRIERDMRRSIDVKRSIGPQTTAVSGVAI